MTELKEYVDELFRHQPVMPEIQDLREEILSNMAAKRDDLMAQGMEKGLATIKAKESLSSIDLLIEGNQLTDLGKYRFECSETALLHCIIYWILSLPLLYTAHGIFCYAGLLSTVILGANYILRRVRLSGQAAFLSIKTKKRHQKIAWIIWGLFFAIYAMTMAGLSFGSDLWFGRPINIDGPYQIANLTAGIYIPVITVIVPITFGSFTKLLEKSRIENSEN